MLCFLPMHSCVCMRSRVRLAARRAVSLQQAHLQLPDPAQARRSRCPRVTLAAAPVLFAHAFGPCHVEKTYGTSGMTSLYLHAAAHLNCVPHSVDRSRSSAETRCSSQLRHAKNTLQHQASAYQITRPVKFSQELELQPTCACVSQRSHHSSVRFPPTATCE